ncbi:MAG: EAL domain-containing protein, partial [Acidimicrobiales bacterium]
LVLEVTETAMMHDPEDVIVRMTKLKTLGVRLSIDDFGTGYSSLASLRRFPVDVVKIDRSFVASASSSPEDASVVQTLVSLGRTLGLEVVAEGVELDSQLDAVRVAGCNSAQGFLLCRPLDKDQLDALLSSIARAPSPAAS